MKQLKKASSVINEHSAYFINNNNNLFYVKFILIIH